MNILKLLLFMAIIITSFGCSSINSQNKPEQPYYNVEYKFSISYAVDFRPDNTISDETTVLKCKAFQKNFSIVISPLKHQSLNLNDKKDQSLLFKELNIENPTSISAIKINNKKGIKTTRKINNENYVNYLFINQKGLISFNFKGTTTMLWAEEIISTLTWY